MDRFGVEAKSFTIIQDVSVRSCELRLERRSKDENATERIAYICGASGGPEHGYVLAASEEDCSSMVATCNACPIPDALESHRACLNLVPVRRFSSGKLGLPVIQAQMQHAQTTCNNEQADVYFPCRWFYQLDGQNQPRTPVLCHLCPHWFPRPPRELIPDYWPAMQKILRVVNGEETIARPRTGCTPPAEPSSSTTWWQRILQKVYLWMW